MKDLNHITAAPRTTAACLNNIKRCLSFLRDSKPKADPNMLYVEQAVLEGQPAAISQVFDEIYKAYDISVAKIDKKM